MKESQTVARVATGGAMTDAILKLPPRELKELSIPVSVSVFCLTYICKYMYI